MTNSSQQADEIVALQAIFDRNFCVLKESHQYELFIEFDLPPSFTIRFNERTSLVQHLPPLSLLIDYHDEYPSDYPPSFLLSCFYFSRNQLEKLCQQLDQYVFIKGEVCVYDWIELLKQQITNELVIQSTFQEPNNDPRALKGYTMEHSVNVFDDLMAYNYQREKELFQNQLQTCYICTNSINGFDCIRLHRCGHFYCRSCLNNYVRMTFEHGKFGEKLHCPQNQCQELILPTEVKQIVQDEILYERYERLTLQHGLESMNDIVWCPRCQSPVLSSYGDDNLAMCDRCRYTFCKKCKKIYHSQTLCEKDYQVTQTRLQRERQFAQEKQLALVHLSKIKKEDKSFSQGQLPIENYREIVMKLSEQNQILEEILNAQRLYLIEAQLCPNCHIPIEKNGGCSNMKCTGCDHRFIWRTINKPTEITSRAFLANDGENWMKLESIKQELNEVSTLAEPMEETDNINVDGDLKILVNNQSAIGYAVLSRIKECLNRKCEKINVKLDEDNWIVCSACLTQYCFLCGYGVRGAKHFGFKCERYTSV